MVATGCDCAFSFATADLPRFFLEGVLALLLFAGSLHVDAKELGQRRFLILLLVTTSVILSTLVFGTCMWLIFAAIGATVPLAWCFVLSAILERVPDSGLVRTSGMPAPRIPQAARTALALFASSLSCRSVLSRP